MSDYWNGKNVAVTGHKGFLGTHLCKSLTSLGAHVEPLGRPHYDLRRAQFYISRTHPVDVLFHLAADVGGIADNLSRPADILFNNVTLNANVVDSCRKGNVGKVIALGSSCAYPVDAPQPYREADYLKDEPEITNAPYAYSKRILLSHLQATHTQYGLDYTYLILANLYGEGCETDPARAHVIGVLVRKFYEAKRDGLESVTLWGAGQAEREFLYVHDAVESLLTVAESETDERIVNIGTGIASSIKDAATHIATSVGYTGETRWNANLPTGSRRRFMFQSHRFTPTLMLSLAQGIERTVAWYASTQERARVTA